MGKHAAATARRRSRTPLLLACLPLVLVGTSGGSALAGPVQPGPPALVTPAADGSVPDVPAPDGYYPGP